VRRASIALVLVIPEILTVNAERHRKAVESRKNSLRERTRTRTTGVTTAPSTVRLSIDLSMLYLEHIT